MCAANASILIYELLVCFVEHWLSINGSAMGDKVRDSAGECKTGRGRGRQHCWTRVMSWSPPTPPAPKVRIRLMEK